jgi:hypothetical protein
VTGRRAATLRRFLVRAALAIAGLYLLAVGAACTFQRSMVYLPDPKPVAPDPSGPKVQVVNLTTPDGERLVAWFLPPAPGKPVLLYFGGNGEGLNWQTDNLRQIARAGVGTLDVAYRGYSGSTGHPTEAGLHTDAETAYAWLAARYKPQDIVISGHSLGAAVAVRLASEHPARALALEAPFTSALDMGELEFPWAPVRLLMWDRFESDRRIGEVRMPALIVHGDQDEVIPFAQGQALFALANQPKAFVRVPGGHHDDLPSHGFYDDLWRFLGIAPAAAAGSTT